MTECHSGSNAGTLDSAISTIFILLMPVLCRTYFIQEILQYIEFSRVLCHRVFVYRCILKFKVQKVHRPG